MIYFLYYFVLMWTPWSQKRLWYVTRLRQPGDYCRRWKFGTAKSSALAKFLFQANGAEMFKLLYCLTWSHFTITYPNFRNLRNSKSVYKSKNLFPFHWFIFYGRFYRAGRESRKQLNETNNIVRINIYTTQFNFNFSNVSESQVSDRTGVIKP